MNETNALFISGNLEFSSASYIISFGQCEEGKSSGLNTRI